MKTIPENAGHMLVKYFVSERPLTILDIGLSYSTIPMVTKRFFNNFLQSFYGDPSLFVQLDGIKPIQPNEQGYNLTKYNRIYEGNPLDIISTLDPVDCVIIGDLLPYLDETMGRVFMQTCLRLAKQSLVISIPVTDHNKTETVLEKWIKPSVRKTPNSIVPSKNVEGLRGKIGLSQNRISEINLHSLSDHVGSSIHRHFFLDDNFFEHYRLLAFMSTLFSHEIIFDIGTNFGNSALALSFNPANRVISYDIEDILDLKNSEKLTNIEFNIGDVREDPRLLKSPLILLDTYHDGIFEKEFYEFLSEKNFKGILLLDDIHLSLAMENFWDLIQKPKEDITDLGHWSGTGVVDFTS